MPAATLSRRRSYSARLMAGTVRTTGFGVRRLLSVGGKLSHRLRDLLRAGHEELLLRPIERHGGGCPGGGPRRGGVQVAGGRPRVARRAPPPQPPPPRRLPPHP